MPIYNYKARDEEGRLLTGRLEAKGEEDLQMKLQNTGFILTRFSLERRNVFKEDIIQGLIPISPKDKYTLTLQLANTIDAGVPIMSALSSIIEDCRNKKLAEVLGAIHEDLKSGVSFAGALGKHPAVFSRFFIGMVELGENSGSLAHVLYELAEYIKREREVSQKVISALTYPTVLILAALGLVTFVLTSILPQFITIYVEAGVSLPLPTQILLILSKLITSGWPIILGIIAGGIMAFRVIAATKTGRLKIDQIKLKLPILGNLFRRLYIYQFVEALRLLYNSGLPIIRALKIIEEVIQNREMANIVGTLSIHLAKGEALVEYLRLVDFFPSDVLAMIKVGEEGGRLGAVLNKASEIYREEINNTIIQLVSLIEPAIIICMGAGVGFLAMAILFPIFQLNKVIMR